jgi:hypothetical protein
MNEGHKVPRRYLAGKAHWLSYASKIVQAGLTLISIRSAQSHNLKTVLISQIRTWLSFITTADRRKELIFAKDAIEMATRSIRALMTSSTMPQAI